MSIMGHSDVQTTMNIYKEIQETKRKEAVEDLNDKIKISLYRKKEWEQSPFLFFFTQIIQLLFEMG